jgi:hypothetical protein
MQGNLSKPAPRLPEAGQAEIERKLSFLLRVFTPRTVFMEIGSRDCEL